MKRLYYILIKKNLEISFQSGPEHETTSEKKIRHRSIVARGSLKTLAYHSLPEY